MEKASRNKVLMKIFIGVAIVVIAVGIVVPSYLYYEKKTHYRSVVETADRYKLAVMSCLEERKGSLEDCDAGKYGIPPDVTLGQGDGYVESITVNDGVITVIPKPGHGISANDTYILTPSVSTNGIAWMVSGGVCKHHLVPGC